MIPCALTDEDQFAWVLVHGRLDPWLAATLWTRSLMSDDRDAQLMGAMLTVDRSRVSYHDRHQVWALFVADPS